MCVYVDTKLTSVPGLGGSNNTMIKRLNKTNNVDKILSFFDHLPPSVDTFYR